jgi:hypothetical protein
MLYPVLLICGAVVLIFYVREKIRAFSVKAVILKSIVSAFFIAVGVYGMWLSSSGGSAPAIGPLIVMGLVCGLLGDIWLDLKYVFPEQQRPFTLTGFCVFGIGHIFYITGMLLTYFPKDRPLFAYIPFGLGVLMTIGNIVLEKPMKLDFGELRPTVGIYGFFLFTMLTLSGSLALAHGWKEMPLNLLFAGGVLFTLSDLILSGTYFGKGKDRPIDIILNYITYYGGQFLIASSLIFLK